MQIIDIESEYDLILTNLSVESPKPIINEIQIPNGNPIDLSEYFGELQYSNRKISLEFSVKSDSAAFYKKYSDILLDLHGKVIELTLNEDPFTYFKGRVSVENKMKDNGIQLLTLSIDAQPYRYKNDITIFDAVVGDNILQNWQKKTPVIVITTEPTIITFKEKIYNVDIGTYNLDLLLEQGDNVLNVDSPCTFNYQERGL